MKRLIILAILAAIFPVIVLWPELARAQEPSTWNGWTILHYSELLPLENGPYTCGTGDPLIGQINGFGYMAARSNANGFCEEWNQVGVFEASIGDLVTGSGGGQMTVTIVDETGGSQWHFYYYASGSWSGSLGNYGSGTHTINAPEGTTQLAIAYYSPYSYMGSPYITGITLTNITTPGGEDTCSLVPNAGFNFENEDWLFYGDATLNQTNTLTLGPQGEAFQDIASLRPNSLYNAVISVTSTTISDVLLRLGTQEQLVEIQGTGLYTATFSTAATISSTVPYVLKNTNELEDVEIDFTCLYGAEGFECPLVPDADFNIGTGWNLSQATISSSTLTLKPTGYARQSLSLDAGTSYGGIISVTNVANGASDLSITIGDDETSIPVDAPGEYTFAFTTPTSLGGPLTFGPVNHESANFQLGAICIYALSTDGSGGDCIAPINGTFDTPDGWLWMRGAEWYSPAKEASLPYADTALVASTYTYSLPTISTGEHLLLSFTSRKYQAEPDGGIMGRVKSGVNSASFTYEVYPTEYTFETSLDYLAGHNDAEIAFVNPGLEGSPIFSGTADVSLDDICIFVANRNPQLPYPSDPNAITPIDLEFNYTSCDDIDGILAGFGINIQQYRAEYEAGASIWDPIGWVPWLIAAMWNVLATWLCIFMAAFVTLVDILEYLINNFLNIGNWLIRSWPIFINFLDSCWQWFKATVPNLWDWLAQAFLLILLWFYLSGGNIVVFTAFMLAYFIQVALDFLSWLGFDLPVNVIDLLLNGLKALANIFITGWNLFIVALGGAISNVVSVIVWVWNLLVPVLEAIWGYISSVSLIGLIAGLIFGFSWSILGLLWTVFQWLWANVLLVVNLPLQLYYGFDQGTRSDAFDALIACTGENFWCAFFAGIQVINQTVGQTILYPIVIAGIILATIGIFWRNIWKLFTIDIA